MGKAGARKLKPKGSSGGAQPSIQPAPSLRESQGDILVVVDGVVFEMIRGQTSHMSDACMISTPIIGRTPLETPLKPITCSPQEILSASQPTTPRQMAPTRVRKRADSDASMGGRISEETRRTYLTPPTSVSAVEESCDAMECTIGCFEKDDDDLDLSSARLSQYAIVRPETPIILRKPHPIVANMLGTPSRALSRESTASSTVSRVGQVAGPARSGLLERRNQRSHLPMKIEIYALRRSPSTTSFIELHSPIAINGVSSLNKMEDERALRRDRLARVRQWAESQ